MPPVHHLHPAWSLWSLYWQCQHNGIRDHSVQRDPEADRVAEVVTPAVCEVLDGHDFFPGSVKEKGIFIRDEYKKALQFMNEQCDRDQTTSWVVVGHSGIGKTLFLYYTLVRRLIEHQVTLFQRFSGNILLFNSDGVHTIDSSNDLTNPAGPDGAPHGTWALADSNSGLVRPDSRLYLNSDFFLIQAASFRPNRWDWLKYANPDTSAVYHMQPWTLNEIFQARNLQKVCHSERDLAKFYVRFSPSAGDCYSYAAPHARTAFAARVELAVSKTPWEQVRKVVKRQTEPFEDGESHKVFLIKPMPENRLEAVIRPCSPYIRSLLLAKGVQDQRDYMITFFTALLHDPKSTGLAGIMLQTQVLQYLPKGVVRTVKKLTFKPNPAPNAQWMYRRLSDDCSTTELRLPPCQMELFDTNDTSLDLSRPYYYQPLSPNHASFDAFIYESQLDRFTLLQIMVADEHDVKIAGLNYLRKLASQHKGVDMRAQDLNLRYVAVVPINHAPVIKVPIAGGWSSAFKEVLVLEVAPADLGRFDRVEITARDREESLLAGHISPELLADIEEIRDFLEHAG